MALLTYQYRIKESSVRDVLTEMKSHVNFVWNFSRDIISKLWSESRQYATRCLLSELTKGSSSELAINSQSIQATYEELLDKTQEHRKQIRKRHSSRKLGWIPFKGQTIKVHGNSRA